MIALKIGDLVQIDGKEYEVWCLTTQQYADRTNGTLELADPLWATRQREAVGEKRRHQEVIELAGKMMKEY